ncbi:MAG: hypothetical protein AAF413_03105 [Patescibacteria group bacterium]
MVWIMISAMIIVVLFGSVLLIGAPYLPTRRLQVEQALHLLDLQPGQKLYELGAGTGGLSVAASEQGVRVIAIEANPIVFTVLWVRALRRKNVHARLANFWNVDVSDADGVYVFLIDRFMPRLDGKLSAELPKGARLVSYAFKIPDKEPDDQDGPMFLYEY